jgi:hypothetical protein
MGCKGRVFGLKGKSFWEVIRLFVRHCQMAFCLMFGDAAWFDCYGLTLLRCRGEN